jgi:hypothetical protein
MLLLWLFADGDDDDGGGSGVEAGILDGDGGFAAAPLAMVGVGGG